MFMDMKLDQEILDPQDVEYESSKCKTPHSDGSTCIPEWDGYGFVCPYYVISMYRAAIRNT